MRAALRIPAMLALVLGIAIPWLVYGRVSVLDFFEVPKGEPHHTVRLFLPEPTEEDIGPGPAPGRDADHALG